MKKKLFYSEIAYILGIIILAFGTALSEKADFGMSMVVAPAYLVHLKLSEIVPWFSFGMAEYCLQAILLVILSIAMKRFKKMYLFSFVTAVYYGIVLDLLLVLVGMIPFGGIVGRVILFVAGVLACSLGVAMLFNTYIAPEAYELVVKEVSSKFKKDISKTKIVYDCCSCAIAIVMSFIFFGFGHFEGVKYGTVICALVNGILIGWFSKLLNRIFEFKDGLKFRKYFE